MKPLLTVREAAPVLRMSEQGLYTAIREHQLPDAAIVRIGRRIRLDPTFLQAAVNDRQADTKGSDGSEARDVEK